jgi:hypothetical protein
VNNGFLQPERIPLANSRRPRASRSLGKIGRSAKDLSPTAADRDELANSILSGTRNLAKPPPIHLRLITASLHRNPGRISTEVGSRTAPPSVSDGPGR